MSYIHTFVPKYQLPLGARCWPASFVMNYGQIASASTRAVRWNASACVSEGMAPPKPVPPFGVDGNVYVAADPREVVRCGAIVNELCDDVCRVQPPGATLGLWLAMLGVWAVVLACAVRGMMSGSTSTGIDAAPKDRFKGEGEGEHEGEGENDALSVGTDSLGLHHAGSRSRRAPRCASFTEAVVRALRLRPEGGSMRKELWTVPFIAIAGVLYPVLYVVLTYSTGAPMRWLALAPGLPPSA